MAHTYRPDLLPLALPTRIGLPYHGLVTNGRLPLPGIGTLAYPAPQNGSAWKVANPAAANTRARTPEEIADDTAHGYAFKPWALVNDYGSEKRVGQYPLAEKRWLYMDPAGTVWQLEVGSAVAGDTITITVAVRGRWGVFANSADPAINRQIGSTDHQVTLPTWWSNDYNGNRGLSASDIAAGFASYGFVLRDLDFTESGSRATWNLRSAALVSVGTSYFPDCTVPGDLLGWADISVSGTGSLQPGTFGAGIAATITTRGLDDVWEEWECIPYDLDPSDPSNFNQTTWSLVFDGSGGPTDPCPGTGSAETDGTFTYTVALSGSGVAKNYYVWRWVGRTYVHANGVAVKAFFTLYRDYANNTSSSGSYSITLHFLCSSNLTWYPVYSTACTNTLAIEQASHWYETYEYGITVGTQTTACTYKTVSDSSRTDYAVGEWFGCAPPAGIVSSDSYHELTAPDGTQTTYQVDEFYAATWQMQIASRSNACWGVRFANVWTLRPSPLQARVASRHLVTDGSSTALTGDPYSLAFSATLHPVTGAIAWSDTDSVCFV